MDKIQCCEIYYGCMNHGSEFCEKCAENKKMKNYYEDNFKTTCHRIACLYNRRMSCTRKKEVGNYGKDCLDEVIGL